MKLKPLFYIGYFLFCISLPLTSCKYDTEIANPQRYVKIYMPQAVGNPVIYDFAMTDTTQTIIYGANYGGIGYPDKNVIVDFVVNMNYVDSFNYKNGTNYLPMPSTGYSLEQTESVIPAGKLSTDPMTLSIKTEGVLEPSTKYLLPLGITDKNGIQVSGSLGTTYFVIQASY